MLFGVLVLVVAIHVSTGLNSVQKSTFTKEQLDAMPSYERAYFDRNCPKNQEWKHCKNRGIPDCTDPRPLLKFVNRDCRPGCQCKKGFIISSAGCVRDCSQENCPRPNEIRSKCIPRPECQHTCFPPSETPISIRFKRIFNKTYNCDDEKCIPFECECQKGYIRLHNTPRKVRCVPLATCKKLKDQYGSSLPSGVNVTALFNK
ncbi:unnamed protein product [Cylicocyclus nassatus]|uniref:TIL domain-containing protein n=1 Tax=Cylicocyclus nassatus TaxID=53992 RepID=A0AA36GI10_CYLNA|nr:unnamed protein product [Cylicocyclus nassatus]